jgi:hypothetical protein
MKRIVCPVLLGLCILFLLPTQPRSAQQTEQKTEPKKMTALKWVKLKDGTQILRIWQLERPDAYPQIAVLRISNAKYLKYFEDPKGFMEFVNANEVFSKPVNTAGPWVTLSSYNPDNPKADPDWALTLVHGKLSTMIVSALPQLNQEYPAPPK